MKKPSKTFFKFDKYWLFVFQNKKVYKMTIYKCYIDIVFRSKKNFEQQKFIVKLQNHDN